MKQSNFVKCGFEFTAAAKKKGKVKSKVLTLEFDGTDHYIYYIWGEREYISKYKWICDKYSMDSCGCEVPTPIIYNYKDVPKYFKEFEDFANTVNITIDIENAKCCLGGCHIHKEMPKLTIAKSKLFFKNVAIFVTNYPQLNWGFNDPNDNENANSLLCETTPLLYCTSINDDKVRRKVYRDVHPSPLKAVLYAPFKVETYKMFAIRHDISYNTIEFRIFDMPKNLKQHMLHYDVATAIYEYCLNLAKKGKLLKLKYHAQKDYDTMSLDKAISEFRKSMKTLKISKNRTAEQIDNIITRYRWNKENDDENYLL